MTAAAEARGQDRLSETNKQVVANLDKIITETSRQNHYRPDERNDEHG
jgi:hypothetical protein